MLIDVEVQQKIASFFGLRGLNAVPQNLVGERGNPLGEFQLLYYWAAEIAYFQNERLIVAVAKWPEWHKGLILIPPMRRPRNREFGGPRPLKPVNLGDWQDPVVVALKSLDVIPQEENTGGYGTGFYSYNLIVGTRSSYTEFLFGQGPTDNASLDRLWDALVAATFHIVDLYRDKEMRKFVYERYEE